MITTRVYWALLVLAFGIGAWRIAAGEVDPTRLGQDREYALELEVELRDAIGPFEFEIYVPRAGNGLRLQEEEIGGDDLELRVTDTAFGRRLMVRGDRSSLPARVRYAVRATMRPVRFDLPTDLRWRDLAAPSPVDSTDLVPVGHVEITTALRALFPEALPDSVPSPTQASQWQEVLRRAGIEPVEAVDRIHRRCLEGLRSADFSGRTSALTALRLGEASCGGKSRLMTAMCGTLGLESRLVGGLILGDGVRKRTSHVWVEVKLGDQWVVFDPLNGHRAERPGSYLQLYVGDLPLIVHARGLAFDYGFRAPLERIPSVWASATKNADEMRDLPLLRRDQFSLILLAPFALLLVVFMRQVVGINSIGVFLPVLLGYCVTQVGWLLAAALLVVTILLGTVVRLALARMNMLHVPRAALLITFLVLLFLASSVLLDRLGIHTPRGLLVLPMAALAMTVERVTVVALDQGTPAALRLLAQTVILSVLCAIVLQQPLFKVLTVSFPEILLVVLAEILLIGQYRGLRLTERKRFGSLLARNAA